MIRSFLNNAFRSLIVVVSLPAFPAALETIQASDIANIRSVTDPQISPDGKTVAYVVETPVKAGEQKNAHIWLVATDGSEPQHPFIMSA